MVEVDAPLGSADAPRPRAWSCRLVERPRRHDRDPSDDRRRGCAAAANPNIELTQIYADEFRELLEDRFGPIPGDVVVSEVDIPIGDHTEGNPRFESGAYYECGIPWSPSVKPDLGTIARMVGQCFVGAVAGEDA